MKRTRAWAALAAAGAVLLAACGGGGSDDPPAQAATGGWQSVVDAANQEGTVTLYTTMGTAQIERVTAAFEKAYPEIQMESLRGASNEIVTRLEQERAQNLEGADVALASAGAWFRDRSGAGDLVPLADLPSAEEWKGQPVFADDYFTSEILPLVILWNSDIVTEPIESYEDLLRPDLKGKIGTLDLVSPTVSKWYSYLDDQVGDGFVEKLAAQDLRLYQSTEPLHQAVGSGEVGVAAFMVQSGAATAEASGAPVTHAVPPNAPATTTFAGGAAWSHHPNATRVLLDFLMSPAGQDAVNGEGSGVKPLEADGVVMLKADELSQEQMDDLINKYGPLVRQ